MAKTLHIVKFHGIMYVMADDNEEAIEVAKQNCSDVDAWATKATGCYPKFRNKIPPQEETQRTCSEILKQEGYKLS